MKWFSFVLGCYRCLQYALKPVMYTSMALPRHQQDRYLTGLRFAMLTRTKVESLSSAGSTSSKPHIQDFAVMELRALVLCIPDHEVRLINEVLLFFANVFSPLWWGSRGSQ